MFCELLMRHQLSKPSGHELVGPSLRNNHASGSDDHLLLDCDDQSRCPDLDQVFMQHYLSEDLGHEPVHLRSL